MNRVLPYLIGPELYWAIICAVVQIGTRRNQAPDPSITELLDRYWTVLPLVAVPLTFALFLVSGAGRWWLLLRIDLAIAIGLAVATTQYCEGMTHHQPSAGPGAGTAWMGMLGLGYTLMLLATLIAAAVIGWRSRGMA
jgi:hypothetical protein